tara:strand:+ start:703 stop:1980 length:1278 start_codon:yes stop_codon:yes gene_type:complete
MNLLIVHGYSGFPLRSTIKDSLYSFKELANCNVFYLNLFKEFDVPQYILNLKYDAIIFHTSFMSFRWCGDHSFFEKKIIEKCKLLKNNSKVKCIMPQDEWIHTDVLNDFIQAIDINVIFTVAPESEWNKIYNTNKAGELKFLQILTGYIPNRLLKKSEQFKHVEKVYDIGYRAFRSPPWLGRRGYLKTKVADVFLANSKGLKLNISINGKDTILGDKWYDFLASCKYFIGVEGGSTVLDPKGEIWAKGIAFEKENPNASFEDFEENCFKGLDETLNLIVISPRHLEACLTRTCQVLINGDYNGILQPDIHYISLNKDFSNLDEVLEKIKDDKLRNEIVENASNDLVSNGKYTYKDQAITLITFLLNEFNLNLKKRWDFKIKFFLLINRIHEVLRWKQYAGWNHSKGFWNTYYYSIKPRIDARIRS